MAPADKNNTKKTMEVEYFKGEHKVLKNSLHDQIWSDFEKISIQTKLGKCPSYPGKTKITKFNFLMNFVRFPLSHIYNVYQR
jgi:hypothetical protein